MPENRRHQAIVGDPACPKNSTNYQRHHYSTAPLVAMGQSKEHGGDQHYRPSLQSYMDKDGHGEPAVNKLLAEPRGNREDEIGKQLHRGLRQNPFRKGL